MLKFCPYLEGLFFRAKDYLQTKLKNKQHRTIIAVIAGTAILVVMTFYTLGPTEYRVARLSAEQNHVALLQMVADRTHSSFFSNVTMAATGEIISSKNQKNIDHLSEYILDRTANVQQKKAIIKAFTANKVLVPNFFEIYDNEVELQEILKENGLAFNPDVFRKKMLGEINNLLTASRNVPGNYDNQIAALQAYNVNEFADDKIFKNLKGILDVYAIQKHLLENDNSEILQYLKYLQNQPDVPVLAQNSHFFKALEVRVKQRKAASDSIDELKTKISSMTVANNSTKEHVELYEAQAKINAAKYIEYFGVRYSTDGTLYVSISGGGWAEIINPPREVKSFKRYSAYVVNVGKVENKSNYKPWIVPMYKIVDITSELALVKKNAREIKKRLSEQKDLENKIPPILGEKHNAEGEAQKLFNNMGTVLNKIDAEKIFEFSKNNGIIPLFEQN